MIKKIYLLILIYLTTGIGVSADTTVYIKTIVDDEIITNLDIEKESSYLMILNPALVNLDKKKVEEIGKKSLITEIIKKKELKKLFNFEVDLPIVNKVFKDFYKSLNYSDEKSFKKALLAKKNYNILEIKQKLKIELLWNELIVKKYSDQIKINEKNLLAKINKNKNKSKSEFLLSEIFFNKKKNISLDNQIKKINESIEKVGFNNTANIYSISSSSNLGGKIGWIEQDNLSKKILDQLMKIKIGQHTDVINVGNGFLILKIEDKKIKKTKIDKKVILKEMITFERNKQFSQFSQIHFNKVKINFTINEK